MSEIQNQLWNAIEKMPFKDLLEVSEYILEGWEHRFDDAPEDDAPRNEQERYYAFANALSDYAESWKEDHPTPQEQEEV